MKKNILPLLIASIFIIIFLGLLYMVLTKKIESFDHLVYEKISKLISPSNTRILKSITFFGSVFGIILSMIIACFFLKNNVDRLFLGLGMLGEVILNNVIKVLVKRIRPAVNPLVIETNYSFPSGHTMAITALISLLLFFIWQSPLTVLWKIIITIVGVSIIFIIAFSRVYLGVHYTSDVLAAICLSLTYVMLITLSYPKLKGLFI